MDGMRPLLPLPVMEAFLKSCEDAPNSDPAASVTQPYDFVRKDRHFAGSISARNMTLPEMAISMINQQYETTSDGGQPRKRFHSLLLLVGLYTRLAALVMSGEMAFAYFMAHAPKSFYPAVNGGTLAILYCFVFLYFVFAGGGPWSVDRVVLKQD
jgi:hypothetical protein